VSVLVKKQPSNLSTVKGNKTVAFKRKRKDDAFALAELIYDIFKDR